MPMTDGVVLEPDLEKGAAAGFALGAVSAMQTCGGDYCSVSAMLHLNTMQSISHTAVVLGMQVICQNAHLLTRPNISWTMWV